MDDVLLEVMFLALSCGSQSVDDIFGGTVSMAML